MKITFRTKIGLLVAVAAFAVLAVSGFATQRLRQRMLEGRRAALVTAVQAARNIAAGYRDKASNGVISKDEAQRQAKEAIRAARYGGADGKSDYFYVLGTDYSAIMHTAKPEWDGTNLRGKTIDADGRDIAVGIVDGVTSSLDGRVFFGTSFPRPGQKDAVPKLQYAEKVEGWDWIVGSGLYLDDVDAAVKRELLVFGGVTLLVLLLLGAIGAAVARSVLRQIGGEPADAMTAMDEIARGNLAVALPAAARGSVLEGLARMVTSLSGAVAQVRASTENINTASSEIAAGNVDLSQRTEEAASSLQQTSSSLEQLAGAVKNTAGAANTANELAQSARSAATQGGAVVAQVVDTMQEIDKSSKKIAEIIGVIDGIAFRTNILALNAAVEAARAGEQGRGFAVVAGEVRSLAQRSAEAAKEIKKLIGSSVERVEAGSRLVVDAGTTMNDIVASVQRVSDIIGEITAAASEQSDGIGQVSTAVGQLDQVTQQNAALVEQSAAAAESLKGQALQLAEAVRTFRLQHAEALVAASPDTAIVTDERG